MCWGSHKRDALVLNMSLFLPPRYLSLLSVKDGTVPYRRLCTMAQVPLNLRKFLPEANIARNSNPGVELQWYRGGAIILAVIMKISFILFSDPAELQCTTVHSGFFLSLIAPPIKTKQKTIRAQQWAFKTQMSTDKLWPCFQALIQLLQPVSC